MPLRWIIPKPGERLPDTKLVPLLRAAIASSTHCANLKVDFAKALYRSDRIPELVKYLKPTLTDGGSDHPELLYYLGCAALAADDHALAVDALRLAAKRGFRLALGSLADALRRAGRPDEALTVAYQGLQHSPSDFKAFGIVVRDLLERDEKQRLWTLCGELRARGARGAYLPSAMAHAAATPEQKREVRALVNPPRWFSSAQLAMPDGVNRILAAELLSHESLSPLPSTKATLGSGNRINQLELAGGQIAQDLLVRIRAAVETYVAERKTADHLLMSERPASVALTSWAVAVRNDGHEGWHIHPGGWISGVYYVSLPDIELCRGRAGAIEFGPFPFLADRKTSVWPCWTVIPNPGQLLLFPSYYAHRTWSTHVADPRLCVAFDVVPASPRREPESIRAHRPPAATDLTLISRNPALLAVDVAGEILMMDGNGHCFALNEMASEVWRRIEPQCSFDDLIGGLVSDYDADRATITADVRSLLGRMIALDAVRLA